MGRPLDPQGRTVRVSAVDRNDRSMTSRERSAVRRVRPAGGSRRTTSRPRSPCSAPSCCRATRSARSASRAALRRLLQAGAPAHLRRRRAPCRSRGGPVDTITVADELRGRPARPGRRRRGAARPAERHAGDLQRRPLRPHRAGHGDAAPADPRRRRHRRDRPTAGPTTSTRPSTRPSRRVFKVAERRVDRQLPRHQRVDQGGDGPPRGDLRPRRHHHRHRHRLPRPRRAAVRAAAVDAEHRRCPPGDGQDRVRPGHGDPRRQAHRPAGARVLARDGPRRADPADPVERGRGRLDEDAQRSALRVRLGEDRPGDRSPRGAAVPRRQPAGHGDGDPRQGPPPEGAPRRPRPHRHRLPAADERRRQRREPPARGERDQPQPEDPRPRAGGADRRPQPAQPQPRVPQRQAPDAVGPARKRVRSSRMPTS